MKRSARRRTAGPRPWPSLPDDDGQRAAQVALSGGHRGIALGAGDPDAARVEIAQRRRQVVDRTQQEMLDGAGRGLYRGRAERRLPMGREQDPVHAGGLRAAQKRADVVGVLERIEHEDERRLLAFGGPRENVVQAGELPRLHDERYALMAVEAGERRQRTAFDFDDRDPQVRGMEHELLEGGAALGDDEQPDGGPSCDERLLDGAAAGYQLLVGTEGLRRGQCHPARRAAATRMPCGG